MNGFSAVRCIVVLLFAAGVSGCAGSSGMVGQPDVDLTSVKMSEIGLRNQTFLLGFSVSNPNPFPLPVRAVRYRVRLNDHKFAGGETQLSVTIKASDKVKAGERIRLRFRGQGELSGGVLVISEAVVVLEIKSQ